MRKVITNYTDHVAFAACWLYVAAFIGGDLVTATGWDWRGCLNDLRERHGPAMQAGPVEIRNYVVFTSVDHDELTITTGVEFASSANRRITKQWCYAKTTQIKPGDVVNHLDLADVEGTGAPVPKYFTPRNLGPFSLTEKQARALIVNHCRFRN